jgi:hypothetical protein
VQSLYSELVRRADVLDCLQRDATLNEPLRREALVAASKYVQAPDGLNKLSWYVVREPGGSSNSYRRALLQAKEACRLIPDNGMLLNTRGVAEYRTGQFQQALKSLSGSMDLNTRFPSLAGLPSLAAAVVGLGGGATFLSAVGVSVASKACLPALPADLAFLCMAHHQLGHEQEAHAMLVRLREAIKLPRWFGVAEDQDFLREAEALLQKPPP